MNVVDITEKLGLNSFPDLAWFTWYVQATSAISDQDKIYEGLDWFLNQILIKKIWVDKSDLKNILVQKLYLLVIFCAKSFAPMYLSYQVIKIYVNCF